MAVLNPFPVRYDLGNQISLPPGAVKAVPWEMLLPHEWQARRNHGQGLRGIARRGGLSPNEVIWILDGIGWGDRILPQEQAVKELSRRVKEFLLSLRVENGHQDD